MEAFAIVLLVLFAVVKLSNTCKCLPKSFHEAYCQSDFAIVAKVTAEENSSTQGHLLKYVVEPKKIFFQRTDAFTLNENKVILTPRTLSMCRADLQRDTHYLIGGSIKQNAIFVTSCGLVETWSSIPRHKKRALRKRQISCKCEVSGCNSELCKMSDGRIYQPNKCRKVTLSKQCYEIHGICAEEDGVCKWSKTSNDHINSCLLLGVNRK